VELTVNTVVEALASRVLTGEPTLAGPMPGPEAGQRWT
jgi:hypothetical protein